MFEKRNNLIDNAKVFTPTDSSQDIINTNGIRVLIVMYGVPKEINSLDKYRYLNFVKNMRSNKSVQHLLPLPPTSTSVYQHLLRVYYQI